MNLWLWRIMQDIMDTCYLFQNKKVGGGWRDVEHVGALHMGAPSSILATT